MKILTGRKNSQHAYWADRYVAPAFRKLGHTVDETGVYREGYNLGFIVQNQWSKPRKWLGYPVGIWGIDCGWYKGKYRKRAKSYDCMFVDNYDLVEEYREFSRRAVYLPFACNPEIHRAVPAEEKYDVGYIGKIINIGSTRRECLNILRKNGLKVYAYYNTGAGNPPLSWSEACKRYSQCKMIFNYGKDAALNKRVYEGMSIGKLVLTKRIGSEPDNLFVDGKHLVAFNTVEDLVEKAKYYASHPEERRAIAEAGQKLVHEKHKWTDRMQFVIKTLLKR